MSDSAPVFSAADTEKVCCCLCGDAGRPVYDLPPYGVRRCSHCTLVFVSPRLQRAALSRFYDQVDYFEGGVYGDQSRFSLAMALQRVWTAGRLNRIDRIVKARDGRGSAGQRLLEIGSGYGVFLAAARDRGYQVQGVELSRPAVRESAKQGLDVYCGQLVDAPLTGPYDVICGWDTLEHVPDPLAVLRRIRELAADDATVALSTPYFSSLPSRLLGQRWWTLKPAEHIWHYTPYTLRLLAARADLVVTTVIRSPLTAANLTRLDSLVVLLRPARRSSRRN
ncbi:MAG: class I SAM-dependent methyltransferase [Actinomycetota bacterium]|nr:class I SAM-dependent methyltransferase [Actinomycetota bacterium]